ncbi:pilus assembly protein [Baekduia sp. Peel2402]|uniref:pilus assembly protein n=1 Tax=Baekduia sp. Peel2402 TaxID=3458296 RepID=UPI00403EAEA4
MRIARTDSGQASVELLALLPALGLAIALAWQALVAGETWWLATVAAREAARAAAIDGDPARAARAASAALPSPFADGVRVRVTREGVATVRLPIPAVVGGVGLGSATGHARMEPQR